MVGGEEKDWEKGGKGVGVGEEPQYTDEHFQLDFSASTFL